MTNEANQVRMLATDIKKTVDASGMKNILLFEDDKHSDQAFFVWADDGMYEVIRSVAGVVNVSQYQDTQYNITFDLRYDVDVIQANIAREIRKAVDDGQFVVRLEKYKKLLWEDVS